MYISFCYIWQVIECYKMSDPYVPCMYILLESIDWTKILEEIDVEFIVRRISVKIQNLKRLGNVHVEASKFMLYNWEWY